MKSLSVDTSLRIHWITKKDPQIKYRKFEWLASGNRWDSPSLQLASWETMVLFATTIGDFASQLLWGKQQIIHWCVDKAQTFCGQSMDILRTEHGHSTERAQMFFGHSTNILQLTVRQFTGIHNRIPRNLVGLCKLLVTCTILSDINYYYCMWHAIIDVRYVLAFSPRSLMTPSKVQQSLVLTRSYVAS